MEKDYGRSTGWGEGQQHTEEYEEQIVGRMRRNDVEWPNREWTHQQNYLRIISEGIYFGSKAR